MNFTTRELNMFLIVLDAVPLVGPGRTAREIHTQVRGTDPALCVGTVRGILTGLALRGEIHVGTGLGPAEERRYVREY